MPGSGPPRSPASSRSIALHLLFVEGEVEDVEVFGDALRPDGLGDGGEALLQVPAEDY
jgi:hypothetical protein